MPSPLELSGGGENINTIQDWFRRFERHGVNATTGLPTGPGTLFAHAQDGASITGVMAGRESAFVGSDELRRPPVTPFTAQPVVVRQSGEPARFALESIAAQSVPEAIFERSPDYVLVRLEGHVLIDNSAQGLVPLRHDFARLTGDQVSNWLWRFDEREGSGEVAGFVFSPDAPPPEAAGNLIPLTRWFDSDGYDAMSTTDPRLFDSRGAPLDPIWNRYREPTLLGYVFSPYAPPPPATVPLWRWYSVERHDHDTTTHPSWQFQMPTAPFGAFAGMV